MKYILSISILATLLCLTACKTYQMDISQGKNLTTQEISQINVGMSKEAVLANLGTPLQGSSPYSKNRLDYIYTLQKNGGKIQEKCVTIYFKNNKVSSITQEDKVISP